MKAYTTPLSLVGAALILAGTMAFLLGPDSGYVAGGNVVLGLVLVVVAGGLNPELFRYYGRWLNAFWGAIMVLGIVVMVNFLADRYPHRIDLTEGRLHSLSGLTVQTLRGLERDVEVLAFMRAGESDQAELLLRGYAVRSPRFSYEIIDPDRAPERARQEGITQYNTLVVRSGSREQQVTTLEERDVTNAMLRVIRDRQEKAYLTAGHGEVGTGPQQRSLSQLRERLQEIDYVLEDTLLLAREGTVPADCSLLIIAGPRTRFFDDEIDAIRRYLERGGALLAMLDPGHPTGLEELLAEYGIILGDDFVIDTSGIGSLFGLDYTTPIAASYGEHPITRNHHGVMTFFRLARSVSFEPEGRDGLDGVELVYTSQHSWAETDLRVLAADGQRTVTMDEGEDRPGPVPIAVAVEALHEPDGARARLVVFGDANFATDQYFGYQGNGDLALNATSWLVEDEGLISIRPRQAGHNPISLTANQARWVFWITVVFMPLTVMLAGLLVVTRKGNWRFADLGTAGAGVILTLAAVAAVNFLAGRYHHRIDLTAEKLFTLDSQTVEVLDELKHTGQSVQVRAFISEFAGRRFRDLLAEYRYHARNLDFEFVDPQRNALLVEQYDIRQAGTSIIEVEDAGVVRTERITEQSEEALTNALRRALYAQDQRICFTTGHGEGQLNQLDGTGYSILRGRLRDMNLEVVDHFALGVDELDPRHDVLAVVAPRTPFSAAELDAVRDHLDRGGHALILLQPATETGLESLLSEYGIAVGDDFVVDLSGLGQMIGADVSVPVVLDYGEHPVTERIGRGVMSFFPLARSVSPGPDRSRNPQVVRLAQTHPSSWAESDLSPIIGDGGGEVSFDPEVDIQGPVSLAVAAEADADSTLAPGQRARLVVFGDADFASNQYFGQQANGQLVMGSLSWLSEDEERLQIPARQPRHNPINLVGTSGQVILWISVFILPFAVALSGLVVVLRRGCGTYAEGAISWLLYSFAANACFLFVTGVVRKSEASWLAGETLLVLAMISVAVAYGIHRRARWVRAPALTLALLSAGAGFWFIPHDTIKLVYAAVFLVNSAILAWIRATFDE